MGKQRSKSSKRWLDRQHADDYTQRAKKEGYRSRAVYKLDEMHQRDKLFSKGMKVVDLGAAPGGWSQYAKKMVGTTGSVFALDILPIEPIDGVDIVIGDFQEQAIYDQLLLKLDNCKVDLVISDMAPNFSGISDIDLPRAVYLAEIALDFAQQVLVPGGSFLVKLFQGQGYEAYVHTLKQQFASVVTRKPKASRAESREVYLLAQKFG